MSANYRYSKCSLESGVTRASGKGLNKITMLGLFTMVVIMFIAANAVIVKAEYSHEKVYHKMYTSVVVEAGDTVWEIAEENITSGYENINELVEEIGFINGLNDSYAIRSGTVLIIPYYGEV